MNCLKYVTVSLEYIRVKDRNEYKQYETSY